MYLTFDSGFHTSVELLCPVGLLGLWSKHHQDAFGEIDLSCFAYTYRCYYGLIVHSY